jgi:hypothetical protein
MIVHLYIMQIVQLLLKFRSFWFHGKVDISAKNSEGLTAFDMLPQYNQRDNPQKIIGDMLRACRARSSSTLHLSGVASEADYLKSPVQFDERIYISFLRQKTELTNDTRNILLVVAALLVTITFQGTLSPPGGVWQDDYFPPTNTSNSIAPATRASSECSPAPHSAGTAIMGSFVFILLTVFHLSSFCVTVFIIFVLLPRSYTSGLFTVPLLTVYMFFLVSLLITAPTAIDQLIPQMTFFVILPPLNALLLPSFVWWRRRYRKLIETFLPKVKLLDPTLT